MTNAPKPRCCANLNERLQISCSGKDVHMLPCRWAELPSAINTGHLNHMRRQLCEKRDHCYCVETLNPRDRVFEPDFRPRRIVLSGSQTCNLDCYYCWRNIFGQTPIDESVFPRVEEEWISGAESVTWSGGEFYFDGKTRKRYLDWREKYDLRLAVITNGALFDPGIPVDEIILTLHGFDRQSYITNSGKDVFGMVKHALPKMTGSGKLASVSCLMNAYNCEHVEEYIAFVKEYIPKTVLIRVAHCHKDAKSTRDSQPAKDCVRNSLVESGYDAIEEGV